MENSQSNTDPTDVHHDVIIIDTGSGSIKAGWSGHDHPVVEVPTVMLETSQGQFFGRDAEAAVHRFPGCRIVRPVQRGEIVDLTCLEALWRHVVTDHLNVPNPEDHSVLLTCPPSMSKRGREKMAQVWFRSFKVQGVCIVNQSVLSLFATGRTTGIVLQSGEGVTHVVPVFEGFALEHATERMELAGSDVTQHLIHTMARRGTKLQGYHVDVVRHLKKAACLVRSTSTATSAAEEEDRLAYELPDGDLLTVETKSRYELGEVLFKPALLHSSRAHDEEPLKGFHDVVMSSINACDDYLRDHLLRNVVVAGGTTMAKGFAERLRWELRQQCEQWQTIDVVQDSQRRYASWMGGSMFASLPTFDLLKVSQKEFHDNESAIHQKYF